MFRLYRTQPHFRYFPFRYSHVTCILLSSNLPQAYILKSTVYWSVVSKSTTLFSRLMTRDFSTQTQFHRSLIAHHFLHLLFYVSLFPILNGRTAFHRSSTIRDSAKGNTPVTRYLQIIFLFFPISVTRLRPLAVRGRGRSTCQRRC